MGWYNCQHGVGIPPIDRNTPLGVPPWVDGIYITEEGEILPIDPEEREAELRRMPSDEENDDQEEGLYITEECEILLMPVTPPVTPNKKVKNRRRKERRHQRRLMELERRQMKKKVKKNREKERRRRRQMEKEERRQMEKKANN